MEPDSGLRIATPGASMQAEAAARVRCVRRTRAIQAPTKHAWSVLWDEAGGRCTRLAVSLAWLAYESGCSERSAGRQLDDLERVHLVRVVERGAKWLVELADPLELDALRVESPPLETQRPLVFPDDDPDRPACGEFAGENAAKTPSVSLVDQSTADPRRIRGENAVANSPPIEPADGKASDSCDLRRIEEDSDALARGVLQDHSPIQILPPSTPFVLHSPNPIHPIHQEDPPLEDLSGRAELAPGELLLTAQAEALAARRIAPDRSVLGQAILDVAGQLWRSFRGDFDQTDAWIPVYLAYLGQVEGGLTTAEIWQPTRRMNQNKPAPQSDRAARARYWVGCVKGLLRRHRPALPWPNVEGWLRDELERIGLPWDPRWDRAWQARRDRRRQHSRDPPRP